MKEGEGRRVKGGGREERKDGGLMVKEGRWGMEGRGGKGGGGKEERERLPPFI
jgi:hypothetical protein